MTWHRCWVLQPSSIDLKHKYITKHICNNMNTVLQMTPSQVGYEQWWRKHVFDPFASLQLNVKDNVEEFLKILTIWRRKQLQIFGSTGTDACSNEVTYGTNLHVLGLDYFSQSCNATCEIGQTYWFSEIFGPNSKFETNSLYKDTFNTVFNINQTHTPTGLELPCPCFFLLMTCCHGLIFCPWGWCFAHFTLLLSDIQTGKMIKTDYCKNALVWQWQVCRSF